MQPCRVPPLPQFRPCGIHIIPLPPSSATRIFCKHDTKCGQKQLLVHPSTYDVFQITYPIPPSAQSPLIVLKFEVFLGTPPSPFHPSPPPVNVLIGRLSPSLGRTVNPIHFPPRIFRHKNCRRRALFSLPPSVPPSPSALATPTTLRFRRGQRRRENRRKAAAYRGLDSSSSSGGRGRRRPAWLSLRPTVTESKTKRDVDDTAACG